LPKVLGRRAIIDVVEEAAGAVGVRAAGVDGGAGLDRQGAGRADAEGAAAVGGVAAAAQAAGRLDVVGRGGAAVHADRREAAGDRDVAAGVDVDLPREATLPR